MTPAPDALDELSARLAQLETTVSRAGEALRAANQTIARLTYQRELSERAATDLAREMRTQSWMEASRFQIEIDELAAMATETPPWTMPT